MLVSESSLTFVGPTHLFAEEMTSGITGMSLHTHTNLSENYAESRRLL